MAEKYQDSIDLFREIYFSQDGTLDVKGYREKYEKKGRDYGADGRSKIAGKSAFTPMIKRNALPTDWQHNHSGDRYYLTLDPQGLFDHHFYL